MHMFVYGGGSHKELFKIKT